MSDSPGRDTHAATAEEIGKKLECIKEMVGKLKYDRIMMDEYVDAMLGILLCNENELLELVGRIPEQPPLSPQYQNDLDDAIYMLSDHGQMLYAGSSNRRSVVGLPLTREEAMAKHSVDGQP